MKSYLELVRTCLAEGSWQENRTGVRTLSIPGAMLRFDLSKGFPAVTTKKLAFKSAMGELVGFLRGYRNAAQFRALGCRVWDQNANENGAWLANPNRRGDDDLGPIYGVQWRRWPGYKVIAASEAARIDRARSLGYEAMASFPLDGQPHVLVHRSIDQVRHCLDTIVKSPSDRRILFHAWNPAELDEMALPPCHLLYQFHPNAGQRQLSLSLYVRSNDLGLGTPFNLAEGAALLHLFAHLTGYSAKWFTYFVGDAHIYETHIPMLEEQLTREPHPLPSFAISDRVPALAATGRYEPEWLERVEPSDFELRNYVHHGPLTAPMAV
jgi:thymidylate synthase